ncbi:MAG: tyrosine-type recombinase/integrase [Woeseiaceae bacterium]|nr:tyrosine-type recombinase/integrase [Woeseiaceae bacterium]
MTGTCQIKRFTRLLKAARACPHPHMYAMTLIALTTGARRGEINGLEWADVDLKKGRATLHATKNTDKRTLVLVPAVVEELKKLPRRIDSGRIFDNPNPEGKQTLPNFNNAWDDVRDRAKLKISGSTTCATLLHRAWRCAAIPCPRLPARLGIGRWQWFNATHI